MNYVLLPHPTHIPDTNVSVTKGAQPRFQFMYFKLN